MTPKILSGLFNRLLVRFRVLLLVLAVATSLLIGTALYIVLMPVTTASGWGYTVLEEGLPNISALEIDAAGNIYATIEKNKGKGYLLKIDNGIRERVLEGLSKPDGMVIDGDNIIISEESGIPGGHHFRIIRFTPSNNESIILTKLNYPEGLAVDENGNYLVVEDRNPGRLLRLTKNGDIEVLLNDLERPEGVCAKDNIIYIAERESGRILMFNDGLKKILIEGLHNPGVVNCSVKNELWITEDKSNTGRLIRFRNNQLTIIASHLHGPQGIVFDENNKIILAEQGRSRILVFSQQN